MKKWNVILLSLFLLLAGCSTTHRVTTDSTQALVSDLKKLSPRIEKVRLTFTRPDLTYSIDMSEEPGEQELTAIVEKVEQFSTVENSNEISRSVDWGLEISEIHLHIDTDEHKETIEHIYYARYFKTSNASDHSAENIEGYSVWYEKKE